MELDVAATPLVELDQYSTIANHSSAEVESAQESTGLVGHRMIVEDRLSQMYLFVVQVPRTWELGSAVCWQATVDVQCPGRCDHSYVSPLALAPRARSSAMKPGWTSYEAQQALPIMMVSGQGNQLGQSWA